VHAVLAVVGCGEEREVPGDAVRRDVRADHARRPGEEVDAIADVSGNMVGSTDDADRDVGDIVVGAPSVGIARRV